MRTSAGLSSTSRTTGGACTFVAEISGASAMRILPGHGQREMEGGARGPARFYPQSPAVTLHDPAADRQAGAGAVAAHAAVGALEHLEDDPEIGRFDAYTVVLY